MLLSCLEQAFDVLHRVVLDNTLANNTPGHAFFAKKVILWVGDHNCRLAGLYIEAGHRQAVVHRRLFGGNSVRRIGCRCA